MTEPNVELARRGWEAALRGDLDAIGQMLHPDVKWHGGDPSSGCQNRAQALEVMRAGRFRKSPPELIEVLGTGDKVVLITRRFSEQGEPELVANMTTFRDGKAIEMVHYPNPDDALAAAGIKP